MGVRVRSGSLCSFLDHQERMSCSFVIRFASGFFGLYSARACASLLALSCLQYRSSPEISFYCLVNDSRPHSECYPWRRAAEIGKSQLRIHPC